MHCVPWQVSHGHTDPMRSGALRSLRRLLQLQPHAARPEIHPTCRDVGSAPHGTSSAVEFRKYSSTGSLQPMRTAEQSLPAVIKGINLAVKYELDHNCPNTKGRRSAFDEHLVSQLVAAQDLVPPAQAAEVAELLDVCRNYAAMALDDRERTLDWVVSFFNAVPARRRQQQQQQQWRQQQVSGTMPAGPTRAAEAEKLDARQASNGTASTSGRSHATEPKTRGKQAGSDGASGITLQQRLSTKPPAFMFIDVETTDSGATAYNRIIEIAVVTETGESREWRVNCHPDRVSSQATNIHGITTEDVHHLSVPPFEEVGRMLVDFISQHSNDRTPVLVAHNGKVFDVPLLLGECQRASLQLPEHWLWADSYRLSVKKRPRGCGQPNALSDLRQLFDTPSHGQAHSALADCKVLRDVWHHLIQEVGGDALAALDDSWAGSVAELALTEGRKKLLEKIQERTVRMEATQLRVVGSLLEDPDSKHYQALHAAATTSYDSSNTYDSESDEVVSGSLDSSGPRDEAQEFVKQTQAEIAAAEAQALATDSLAQEGESELHQQLAERPELVEVWRALLQDDRNARGVLDAPFSWVALDHSRRCKAAAKKFETLWKKLPDAKIFSVWELLQYYPRKYFNFGSDWKEDAHVLAVGTVVRHKRSKPPVFAAHISCDTVQSNDASSALSPADSQEEAEWTVEDLPEEEAASSPQQVVEFMSYSYAWDASKKYKQFAVGTQVVIRGQISSQRDGWKMQKDNEIWLRDEYDGPLAAGNEVMPIYSASTPLTPKDFKPLVAEALALAKADPNAGESLPADVLAEHDLMDWLEAMEAVHCPSSLQHAERGRNRLAFNEMLLLQLTLLLRRALGRAPQTEVDLVGNCLPNTSLVEAGLEALPFQLTGSQDRVLKEILHDCLKPQPMFRLLQGDVGSGKTAVAFLSLLAAAGNGKQGALMAPTETLATQHYNRLLELVAQIPREANPTGRRVSVALLTGSIKTKERRGILAELAAGELDILVGTHSLIYEGTQFSNLAFAIIDEQHKFGVAQRAKLQSKNRPAPHVLTMTATPIPRTLSLVSYGDMALSVIAELPPGRSPINTRAVADNPASRAQMYEHIRQELESGGRAYIVCPLVEASKSGTLEDVKAAEDEHARLTAEGQLGGAAIGLLHGRMAPEDKRAALEKFASGQTPALIATTVVEVGVDVVEASVMVVEHAERFGLAQLHQLRGRVGRGARASSCYLISSDPAALARLRVMEASQDGFVIARADHDHRGPGELLGKKQSGAGGLGCLKAAKLPEDSLLLEAARSTAVKMLLKYGLDPAAWPPLLLASLRDRALPDLDLPELPANSLAGRTGTTLLGG